MAGRSKSRFPEKCRNCIWSRFPNQFWCHFEAMLAPTMFFFVGKEAPRNQSKKRVPPKSQIRSGRVKRKAGWLPESQTLASKSCLDNAQKTTTTTQQKYRQLHNCCLDRLFVFWFLVGFRFQCRLSPWSCWRSGNKFLKEDTVLVIWHALGKGPANFHQPATGRTISLVCGRFVLFNTSVPMFHVKWYPPDTTHIQN